MRQVLHNLVTPRRFNHVLSLVIIGLALYIFAWPFIPKVTWWVKFEAPVLSHSTSTLVPVTDPVISENTLVIPALNMRERVYDGPNLSTLSKGIWHLPDSSSPDKNSNTVMAGHRFTYSGKAVFYNLDKVKVGDNMTLFWQGKRYDYSVTKISVVPPTDASLVASTQTPTLTIYTCTPLWSAKDRLVITAKLAGSE